MIIGQIDSFIPSALADKIEAEVLHHQFPWFWRPSSKYGVREGGENSEDFQFIHLIYRDDTPQSTTFDLAREVLIAFENATQLVIKDVRKIKANLLPRQSLSDEGLEDTIHVDVETGYKKYISIVYYISDSDGDTVLYNANNTERLRVTPKKGKAVYFPSDMKHRATPPSKEKRRIVLNMVVEIE
jgi:hypothetical protein